MKSRKAVIISIMLIAINMRLPITALPPLLGKIEQASGLPSSWAGLLTTIPLLTFALISPFLAGIGRRFGNERVIFSFSILLVIGSLLRIDNNIILLFFGTFLIALGIDSANVLLPAVIKDQIPMKPLLGMSVYSSTMLLVGSIGTGVAGILSETISLKVTMFGLFILTIVGLVGWTPITFRTKPNKIDVTNRVTNKSASVWKSKLSWNIAIFFGLQALIYYSLLTWLPSIFVTQGFSSVTAGILTTVLQIGALPLAFIVPLIADKPNTVKPMMWILGIGLVLGTLGIMLIQGHQVISIFLALVVGIAAGVAFNLAIVFFAQKTDSSDQTAQVSGMAQTIGYLLAAVGPIAFGMIQNVTHSWTPVLLLTILLSIWMFFTGMFIQRHDKV